MRRRADEVSTDQLMTLSPILGFVALVTIFTESILAPFIVLAGLCVGVWTFRRVSAEQDSGPWLTARTALALTGAVPGALIILLSLFLS